MTVLLEPTTHRSDRFMWADCVHGGTSAAHLYAWEQPTVCFSVDVYMYQAFDAQLVVDFTGEFFSEDEIVAEEF
jgi:hypothetical protein